MMSEAISTSRSLGCGPCCSALARTRSGYRPAQFVPAFALLFVLSLVLYVLGQWSEAARYNLEPPLVALVLGLLIANTSGAPRWLQPALRVEFYVKTGIVLLGASLPLTLILWAGSVAIVQAAIVSLVTFGTIYFVGTRLGLDRRLAATLGTGGAVCGVSGAIAAGGGERRVVPAQLRAPRRGRLRSPPTSPQGAL